MHLLCNIIIILMTSYSTVSGNTILGTFAVLSGGVAPASLGSSLVCGKRCNENCAGFYIGPEGACQLFEHGQAAVTLSAGGTFYGKLPGEQIPTLYESAAVQSEEVPRSCTQWKKRDGSLTLDATYSIDPDGVGGEDPINVTCKTDDNLAVIAEIGHNRGGLNSWSGPDDKKMARQSYSFNITYTAKHAQIHTLAANSMSCMMYAEYKCRNVDFNSFRWVAYDGTWYPLNVGTTILPSICPEDEAQIKTCQCSDRVMHWTNEDGDFNDRSLFPVTAVIFGGLVTAINIFEIPILGPIQCQDKPTCTRSPTILFASMDRTEEAYYTQGDQVVYTCFPGLHYPDGSTTMTLTCQSGQMWSGMMYTKCG